MTDCDHPKSEVKVTLGQANAEANNSPPEYWTVSGFCQKCDEVVEISYKFDSIL